LSLALPGSDESLTRKDERELLRFRRGINKLLPEKAPKRLGIQAEII
jgi:hypothetical protein